jgi:hypothetical protein
MTTFRDIDQVKSFKTYKVLLKTALSKLKPGVETKFVALDKYAFDDKERVLILVDFAPALVDLLPKKPTARGIAKVNAADKLVFDGGALPLAKVVKLLAEAGVPRAVADPAEPGDTPGLKPEAEKLDMRAGWTEIAKWGPEAQDLIDAFDGLVGVYKGLPAIPPAWTELNEELDAVKQAFGAIVKLKIRNDEATRLQVLGDVQALTKRARKLVAAVREKALQAQQAKLAAAAKPAAPAKAQGEPSSPAETPKARPAPDAGEAVAPSRPGNAQAQPATPKAAPPRSATITLQPVPPLVYDPATDFAATLAKLARCDSGADCSFAPALSTVRDAKKYTITVTAGTVPGWAAPEPATLSFEIAPADAGFEVNDKLADHTWGEPRDLRALIAPRCRGGDGDPGLFTFDPPLETLADAPAGPRAVTVSLAARPNYRPAEPKVVRWNVLKATQSLKVPKVDDHEFKSDNAKTFLKGLPRLFEKRDEKMGALRFDPPLDTLRYETRDYSIKVWLEENDRYRKSEVEVLSFKVLMNAMDCSSAFNEWWGRPDNAKRRTRLHGGSQKKALLAFCGDPAARIPPPDNYTKKEDLFAALDAASLGLPGRPKIWEALGYAALKTPANWKMEDLGTTASGKKMHLTISYDNIVPLTTLADWQKSDADIFDKLFKTAGLALRVHASLEDFPAPGRNFHVFLGDTGYVSGAGDARNPTDLGGQVGEMIDAIKAFRTRMISAIGAGKAVLGSGA